MKILIKITKEVLEKTKMCDKGILAENCAISYAIREIIPNALTFNTFIYVSLGDEDFFDEIKSVQIQLPKEAQQFIRKFDRRKPKGRSYLPEFSFEIEVPDSVINEIGIGQVYKVLSESKTLEYVKP